MHIQATLPGIIFAASYLVPLCQADPFTLVGAALAFIGVGVPAISAAVGIASKDKRNVPLLDGRDGFKVLTRRDSEWDRVNMHDKELCRDSMKGKSISVNKESPIRIRFEGISPECMTLASFFKEGAVPFPGGADVLVYDNLSQDEMNKLVGAVQNHLSADATVS